MAIVIFILSYLALLILSTIYISPYFFLLWIFTSYFLAILIVVIFYILNFPIVLILKPSHRYKAYLMKSLAAFLNKCYLNLKVEIEGIENIPLTGPLVAYANHKSYTDAFALLEYFPRPITLTPKKSVLKIPFLKAWLKAYDVFPINRDNPKETLQDLEKAIITVKNGHMILLFPEGSIKDRLNPQVESAKAGSFRLVKNAEAGILPIRFEGDDLVRKRWPKRSIRKIKIFPVIAYDVFKDMNTREIAKLFMDTINKK